MSQAAVQQQERGRTRSSRRGDRLDGPGLALALACVGLFVVILDATIVSVALPQIGRALQCSRATLVWVVNAYTLAFGGALLLGGRLVDRYGTRRTFLVGLAVFGTASLLCGMSVASGMLVAARAVQGLGGAVLLPATLTVVNHAYSDGRARARALGLWSAVGAAGGAAGTVAGGILTDTLGWRWVFLVNVPLAAAGVLGALAVLPRRSGRRQPLDFLGAVLSMAGLAALVYGVLAAGTDGWGSPNVAGALAGAAVLLVTFVVHQGHWTAAPLVPPHLLRARSVAAANAVIFCLGLGFFASPVLLSIYVQEALGYTPLQAGLAFLPAAVALFAGAQAAGRLAHRLGLRAVATAGALGATAGFAMLSRLSVHSGYWPDIALPVVVFGLGIGLAFTPITMAATQVDPAMAGMAAGVLNTTRQVSGAIGLALLTALIGAQAGASRLAAGYDLAFGVAAGAAALAAVGAACWLPARAPSRGEP